MPQDAPEPVVIPYRWVMLVKPWPRRLGGNPAMAGQ
jgi:hypothetical protein